jgi:hypothetical protein
MLRPIPTPHPIVTFGSLALIVGMISYELRNGLEKPEPWIGTSLAIAIAFVGIWSRSRRAKAIPGKYTAH